MELYLWWLQTAEIVERAAAVIVCSITCFRDITESSGVTSARVRVNVLMILRYVFTSVSHPGFPEPTGSAEHR